VVTGAVIWRLGLGYRLVLCLTITVAALATAGLGGNSVRTLLQTTHLRRSTRYIHRNSTRGTIDEMTTEGFLLSATTIFGATSTIHRLMQLDSGCSRCNQLKRRVLQKVSTGAGDRLLCEFETSSRCIDCWSTEPLFWDNGTIVPISM
jgi:hypothetical protein